MLLEPRCVCTVAHRFSGWAYSFSDLEGGSGYDNYYISAWEAAIATSFADSSRCDQIECSVDFQFREVARRGGEAVYIIGAIIARFADMAYYTHIQHDVNTTE